MISRRDALKLAAGVSLASIAPTAINDVAAEPLPSDRWNTVEAAGVDEDPRPRAERAWSADAFLFASSDDSGSTACRRLHITGFVDGSCRIAITHTDSLQRLPIERGFSAIHLDPDLGAAVWRGLFAESADAVMPIEPWAPRPWDHDEYIRDQQRLLRMRGLVTRETMIVQDAA